MSAENVWENIGMLEKQHSEKNICVGVSFHNKAAGLFRNQSNIYDGAILLNS